MKYLVYSSTTAWKRSKCVNYLNATIPSFLLISPTITYTCTEQHKSVVRDILVNDITFKLDGGQYLVIQDKELELRY